jgi:hypothetical protein
MAELFLPVSKNTDLINKFKKLGLPSDYYQIYSVVNGEKETSAGIFGLHKLLPLEIAFELIVEDKDELMNFRGKFNYEIFVPIFKIPGRALIGYAKNMERWDFAENDLGTSKHAYAESLTDFLQQFKTKLIADGYTTEEGINGLIDRDEM